MTQGFAFFLCFGVILVIIVGAAVLAAQKQQLQNLNRIYRITAAKLGGTAAEGTLFQRPMLRFTHQGAHVLVHVLRIGGRHKRDYTQLQISWPDAGLRCEVYPKRFYSGVMTMFGMEDIKTGAEDFDDRYLVTGKDPEEIRKLISPGVQAAIDGLRNLTYNNDVYVAFAAGILQIRKQGLIADEETLTQFIRTALDVFDQAVVVQSGAIEFLDFSPSAQPPNLEAAVCRVCLEAIQKDVVFCRSCKTPHHRECWSYYGACSTYGCGQTKFIRNRS